MSDWYPGGAEWDEFEKTAKRNRMSTDERLAREQKDVLMEALKKSPTSDIAEGEII